MKVITIAISAMLAFCCGIHATDMGTISFTNKEFGIVMNAPIRQIDEKGIVFKATNGLERVAFNELPDALKIKYLPQASDPEKSDNVVKVIPSLFSVRKNSVDEFTGRTNEVRLTSTQNRSGSLVLALLKSTIDNSSNEVCMIAIYHRSREWMFLEEKGENLKLIADSELITPISGAVTYKGEVVMDSAPFIVQEEQSYLIRIDQYEKMTMAKTIKARVEGTDRIIDYLFNQETVRFDAILNSQKYRNVGRKN